MPVASYGSMVCILEAQLRNAPRSLLIIGYAVCLRSPVRLGGVLFILSEHVMRSPIEASLIW